MVHEPNERAVTKDSVKETSPGAAASPNQTFSVQSDQTSNDSGDIIHTPSESVSSPREYGSESTFHMTTASSNENASLPAHSSTAPTTDTYVTVTAANNNAIPVLQDGNEPNISKREYIYFLPYPLPPGTEIPYSIHLPKKNPLDLPSHQFEPTVTLVLTSPKRTFVDIRIYKPLSTSDMHSPLPNRGEPHRLEWAFAGLSSSQPITLPPTGSQHGRSQKRIEKETWHNVTHSTWTHWIDSRFPIGSKDIPVDEGDMYPIAEGLTLEVGHAFHPALGAVKTHEEMWRDVDAVSTTQAGTKLCVVLRCQAEHAGVKGLIVRVGQYCQGLVMEHDITTAERWEWNSEASDKADNEQWGRTVRIGNHFLPCSVAWRPELLGLGAVIKYHDFEWVVEELWEWK